MNMFEPLNKKAHTRVKAEIARKKLDDGIEKRVYKSWRFFAICTAVFTLSLIVYFICFSFRVPLMQGVHANKTAPYQILSSLDFSYESDIMTQARKEHSAERIPPSYKINPKVGEKLKSDMLRLKRFLDDRQEEYEAVASTPEKEDDVAFFAKLSPDLRSATSVKISPEDLSTIYSSADPKRRAHAFNLGEYHADEIISSGIYADDDPIFSARNSDYVEPEIKGSAKASNESRARARLLRRMKSLGLSEPLTFALYRTINQNLTPNVEFDKEETDLRRQKAMEKVSPVVVKVMAGEPLTTTNAKITPIIQEKLKAYRSELAKSGEMRTRIGVEEFLESLILVATAALFIVISKTQRNKKPKTVLVFSTLLTFNLALERLILEISNIEFGTGRNWIEIFAFSSAIVLGPMIQVLLFGSYTGFIMALLISAFTTLMLGQTVSFFIVLLLSSLIAIYFCDGAQKRSTVLMGGIIYGAVLAFLAQILGNLAGVPFEIMWRQAVMALLSGGLTGILASTLLPLFGRVFNEYSNIALLEFIDLNNPLLKKLQIEAPGTYHHCVMVSHLAEEAALKVNANPLVCRVGSLYHDIGKIIKPEFFAENQGGGKNPHDDQTPSMSALIIRSHIIEGIEMAKQKNMPAQVIDAIAQHHGTSIISYFYNKAIKQARENGDGKDPIQTLRDSGIDESTYRHEGRKPQNVENAIIMLADSCEAASRSLKRITQHGLEEIVDSIFKSKMTDGQLDECPITVKQLSKIRESFVSTILSMMHSRVEYNNGAKKWNSNSKI